MMCSDILCGYIDEDELFSVYKYARNLDKITETNNNQLKILRSANITLLIKMGFFIRHMLQKENMTNEFSDECVAELKRMSRAELFSRSVFNKARIKIVEFARDTYVKIRYKYIFDAMRRCASETLE